MKILVTGCAGFIGSNFLIYMLSKYPEYHYINIDALTYAGNLDNLMQVASLPNYRFIKGDITDGSLIEEIVSDGIDVIVHFAAESHVDRSILNPDIFVKTNILGTQVLLEAAKRNDIRKFVHISTDEVYGSLGATGLFNEETPLAPNSPYSASKASSDLLVRAYHKTFGLPVNITRCSNNYGPFQFPEKLIPLVIERALNDRPIPIYGDGLNVRDWLYVEDHCSAIDLVLHSGKNGEIYNIGGNNEKTNVEIVKIILECLGKPDSLIQYVKDRPGHDRRYAIDSTKINNQLGWIPKWNFESGIRETVHWYLTHQDWLSRVHSGEYRNHMTGVYQ